MEKDTLIGVLKLSLFCLSWTLFGYGFGYARASKECREAMNEIMAKINAIEKTQ